MTPAHDLPPAGARKQPHRHAFQDKEADKVRWRHIFDHAEWGIVIGTPDGQTLELMNPAFARMHGYTVEELTGRPTMDVFAPESRADIERNIHIAHQKGHHVWEAWHVRRDGSRFPAQLDVTTVRDNDGEVLYRVVNVQDITERKLTEDALRESEAHLARAQGQARLGSWRLDVQNNRLEWSAETYRIFGIPYGQNLDYQTFLDCVHPGDRILVDRAWQAALHGEHYDIVHRILVYGEVKWIRERADLEFDADGSLLRGIGTAQDITELKRKEEELLRSRQLLRELAAHAEKIREDERSHIAREIHDELGQALTALRMDVALLNIRHAKDNPELAQQVASMKKTIDTTIGLVRDVAASLRPAALDMGLVSAAEWLLGRFRERTGIHCKLDAPDDDLGLDDARATAAFRILQESLTNVARHANASKLSVTLERTGGNLIMLVQDDGQGFDPAQVREKKTFGLMGIRERVLIFNGESRIDSRPGAGTSLYVRLPAGPMKGKA